MNKIIFTLLISLLLIPLSVDAQRRTTSVKGYTRKDGTYVRPHTRSYKSGSNSYSSSSSSYSSSSYESNEGGEIVESKLMAQLIVSDKDKKQDKKKDKKKGKSEEIEIQEVVNDSTFIPQETFYIDVYVLRYNDVILDIMADPREAISFYPKYQFHKDKVPSDVVIDLVSNHGWTLKNDILSKTYYGYSRDKDPDYLNRKKEKIQLN